MKKLVLIAVVLFVVLTPWLWYRHALSATGQEGDPAVSVRIEQGASTDAIARMLKEKGLIRSVGAFKWYVRRNGYDGRLRQGGFGLLPSMDVPAITAVLSGMDEDAQRMTVTVPEGYTVRDIGRLLEEKGIAAAGDVERCARECPFEGSDFLPSGAGLADRGGRVEGYLFPDTYFVQPGDASAERFLGGMLEVFDARVAQGLAEDVRASGRSLADIVTMASLIEEETRTDDERPIVAGILWKRYDQGMGLGVDAAVRYVTGKPTAAITVADLNVDSPYNLRKFRGLPPGPIANPGLASIRAALHPEASEYLYYLHGTDGTIRYARANDEHNQNRARYLR